MTDVDALRRAGESQTLEFKKSFSEQEEIIDTLVAFANARGGMVLVGIDSAPSHRLVGVSLGANTLERFDNRSREKAGDLPSFSSEVIPYGDKTVVGFTVGTSAPGWLVLPHGCALIRAARSNQRMTAGQVRARILEDPAVAVARPRFKVEGGSVTDRLDDSYIEIVRDLVLIDGEAIESVEWQFRGTRVTPLMDWQRTRLDSRPGRPPRAQLRRSIDKEFTPTTDLEVCDAEFAITIRFLWRNEQWYELHRFPMHGSNIARQILPSLYRRGEGEWLQAS